MSTTPPTLAYASIPDPSGGVRVERDAHFVQVVVPPVPSWRSLPVGYRVGAALPVLSLIAAALRARSASDFATDALGCALLGVFVALATGYRMFGWVKVGVTADAVYVTRSIGRVWTRTSCWPRDRVLAASVNENNGALSLRVLGWSVSDIDVGPNRADAVRVAATIDRALGEPLAPVPTSVIVTAPPLGTGSEERACHRA